MAKWGEGDPRWIVEERPDATNVNNWHWTERNAGPWSEECLKDIFREVQVPSDIADIKIVGVEKCEGEASANNRKAKLMFFYEWVLTLKWTGKLNGSESTYTGTVFIPNLSEENDVSEVDIQITIKDSDEQGDQLKHILFTKGKEIIREKLLKYIAALKLEFSKGMILPKKGEGETNNSANLNNSIDKSIRVNKEITMAPINSQTPITDSKLDTATINMTEKFQCTGQDFYNAMTKVEMVTAFTRGRVKMDPVEGGKFALFGGNVTGNFVKLVPGKKIVQQWRYEHWRPAGHHSTVTINIEEKNDHTEISFTQTGVPKRKINATQENWQRYYWDAIKRAFGFGAFFTSFN